MVKKIDWKWRMALEIIALLLITLSSAVYYYGLHLSFWPDPEYGCQTLRFFYMENFEGEANINGAFFTGALSYISYKIFGVGFQGIRVIAAVKYFIALTFCAVLSVYSIKERRMKWYLLPLFGFIAVVINPGSSKYCGFGMSSNYHQYPYDMHMESVILALMECFILDMLMQINSRKKKILAVIIMTVICVVGIETTDLCFGSSFWIPMLCYLGVCLWKKHRKLLINITVAFIGMLAIVRLMSIGIVSLRALFVPKQLIYGEWGSGNAIYGDSGFADFDNIWHNIANTLTSLFSLFNVELSGTSILSINTIIAVIRITLVVLIYVIAIRTIIISTQSDDEKQDMISVLCSYAIIFTTAIVMLSSYGAERRAIRYLVIILYYGIILLCRNLGKVLNLPASEMKYFKWIWFIGFSFCVLVNVRPAWKEDSYQAEYEVDFQNVATFLKENKLGNGVGNLWNAPTLVELTEGECVVFMGDIEEGELKLSRECKAHINYFLKGPHGYFNVDGMYEVYGEPSETYEVGQFIIYYYENGIDV